MIKILFTISFLLIFQAALLSQEYWIRQESPTKKNLNACFFSDTLNGWICGASGVILHTSDNGKNWLIQNSGTGNEIVSIFFTDKNTGYALSREFDNTPPNFNGTRILSTTTGGDLWNNYLFPDTNLFLNNIYFLDSLNGYMAGSGGRIFYTVNSGINWLEGIVDSGNAPAFPIEKIKFYDAMTGYASGGAFDLAGVMWKSTNGGRNWKTRVVGPEPIYDFQILNSMSLIGVGGDFEFGASQITSTNGGADWVYSEIGYFGIANSIGFRTQSEVWSSLRIVDSFMHSTNAGISWDLVGTPDGAIINDLIFLNHKHGWAAGNDGVILKFNPTLLNISSGNEYLQPVFSLNQNYPNPFNPVTMISYSLRSKGFVNLKVYDVLGKEAAVLINKNQSAGFYNVSFDGSEMQSGIYFYRLSAAEDLTGREYFESKRMILLK